MPRIDLDPQSPSLGPLVSPQPFVQGEPPKDQSEFSQRFSELRQFLGRPEVRAGLLQFAIANLQSRQPGVPEISAIASSVGQGAAAAGRAGAIEEGRRKQQVLEEQREERIGIAGRQAATAEEAEERQRTQGARGLELEEERNKISKGRAESLKKQVDNQADQFVKRLRQELKIAGDKTGAALVVQASKVEAARAKAEADNLLLIDPKDKEAVAAAVKRAQYDPDNARRIFEGLRQSAGGGTAAGAAGAAPPQAQTLTDENMNLARRNPTNALEMERQGRITLTPDQKQELEGLARRPTAPSAAAPRPRSLTPEEAEAQGPLATRAAARAAAAAGPLTEEAVAALESEAAQIRRGTPGLEGTARPELRAVLAITPGEVTIDSLAGLPEDVQKEIDNNLDLMFPKSAPPTDPEVWRVILAFPALENFIRIQYPNGDELIAAARRRIEAGEATQRGQETESARRIRALGGGPVAAGPQPQEIPRGGGPQPQEIPR